MNLERIVSFIIIYSISYILGIVIARYYTDDQIRA